MAYHDVAIACRFIKHHDIHLHVGQIPYSSNIKGVIVVLDLTAIQEYKQTAKRKKTKTLR